MKTKHALLGAALTALLTGVAAADTTTTSDVRFAFDSAALSASAEKSLESVANKALSNTGTRIVLDGHADPIGSAPYNVGLSLRRAEAVRAQLVKLGVDSDRIVIASFGEDAPLGGSYAAERRVSISFSGDSVASLIDNAFARHGTSVSWEKPLTTAELDVPATDAVATR